MDANKRNLVYFEASSMRVLFDRMDAWQAEQQKRLQAVSIERDGDAFCCIALTNPSEVVIVCGSGDGTKARVKQGGWLQVTPENY